MTIADNDPDAPRNLRDAVKAARLQIEADNEARKEARNNTRWRYERDPQEYDKQLDRQRQEYADKIAAKEGREVRAYTKVPGKTREEHDKNAKARDAERKREERSCATQEDKDREADKRWGRRMKKKGWTEQQIAEGLKQRHEKRRLRQPDPGPYEDNPDYGAF
ncbi:hypothetical protein [Leisingera sp. S232]|uniref:hypothetical protein n=1 Tax=Leisingera sp. S232 TaxID=3415132 RepID=UPI003C7D58AC